MKNEDCKESCKLCSKSEQQLMNDIQLVLNARIALMTLFSVGERTVCETQELLSRNDLSLGVLLCHFDPDHGLPLAVVRMHSWTEADIIAHSRVGATVIH